MKNTNGFKADFAGWARIMVAVIMFAVLTQPGYAGMPNIEAELRQALWAGHDKELLAQGITEADLQSLYLIEKSVEFYGISAEKLSQARDMNDVTSQATRIDFNQPYQQDAQGWIANFVVVLKGQPLFLCDVLIKDKTPQLLGFRPMSAGIDVALAPQDGWVFVLDQLNTHKSESLVRWIAEVCEIPEELGVKGRCGILKSMDTRAAFLSDPSHHIRIVYTPKHASWLNQVEIWFSILVRRLLKRGIFRSKEHLKERIVGFIEYFNTTLAKPFQWTYKGKALTV